MATLHTEIISKIAGSKSFPRAAIISKKVAPTISFDDKEFRVIFRNPNVNVWENQKNGVALIQIVNSNDPAVWLESVRTCVRLGAKEILFVGRGISTDDNTSFCGCIVTNHVNVSGENPLIGSNDESFGVRFPDMSSLYYPTMIGRLKKCSIGKTLTESGLLVCCGDSAATNLEKRIAECPEIKVVSRDVAFGAIAAKHAGIPSAAIVFYPKVESETIVGLIRDFFSD